MALSGRPVTFAERVYRCLLYAYPRPFRAEYGDEMLLVFRDAYHTAAQQEGRRGTLRLLGDFGWDFMKSVCIQRVQNWLRQGEHVNVLAGKEEIVMALAFTLNVGQHTDNGRVRLSNEDNLMAIVPETDAVLQTKGALFVVADGLGGHNGGEVASALAVQKVKEYYYQDDTHTIPSALQEAVKQANNTIMQAIAEAQAQGSEASRMATTCVAAVLHAAMLYVANVGDSRAYVLHDGQLRQITRDHSVVAQMVERGELTAAEARTHEQRNQIYRALGQATVEVDIFSETVQAGDIVLLCTDGLHGVLEEQEIHSILTQYAPDESVQQLIGRANEAGGPDNVTAIVVRVAA